MIIRLTLLVFLISSNATSPDEDCSTETNEFVLNGVLPPVFTPFDESGQVNLSVIPQYANYVKMKGNSGVLLTGTSGEGPNLSVKEKKLIYEAWVPVAKQLGLIVVTQIGGVPLPDIIEMAEFSEQIGVDAILVLPTVYYKPKSPEDLTALLKVVANAAPSLPLLYYNYPEMTGVDVDMPTFFQMATENIPQFKGLKAQLPEVLTVSTYTELKPDQGFCISNYQLISPSVSLGYDVFFATIANIYPELVFDIIKYTKMGNMTEARKLQKKVNNLSDKITSYGYVQSLRAATEIVTGMKLGSPRLPMMPVDAEDRKKIKATLQEYGIAVAE